MVPTNAIMKASNGPALPRIDENVMLFARPHLRAYVNVPLTILLCSYSIVPD
jgi:hypothetical protein